MKKKEVKKYYTYQEALAVLQKFCAYQDRCHQEVRQRLLRLKIYGDDLENIIVDLIREKFLDEERFSRSFVRGKYRLKKWGRNKIHQALKQKDVSSYCIKKGLSEIDEEEYIANLADWINKKSKEYQRFDEFQRNQKIIQFLLNKGFEYELIKKGLSK